MYIGWEYVVLALNTLHIGSYMYKCAVDTVGTHSHTVPICGGVCGMEYCIGSTGLDQFSSVNWSNPV